MKQLDTYADGNNVTMPTEITNGFLSPTSRLNKSGIDYPIRDYLPQNNFAESNSSEGKLLQDYLLKDSDEDSRASFEKQVPNDPYKNLPKDVTDMIIGRKIVHLEQGDSNAVYYARNNGIDFDPQTETEEGLFIKIAGHGRKIAGEAKVKQQKFQQDLDTLQQKLTPYLMGEDANLTAEDYKMMTDVGMDVGVVNRVALAMSCMKSFEGGTPTPSDVIQMMKLTGFDKDESEYTEKDKMALQMILSNCHQLFSSQYNERTKPADEEVGFFQSIWNRASFGVAQELKRMVGGEYEVGSGVDKKNIKDVIFDDVFNSKKNWDDLLSITPFVGEAEKKILESVSTNNVTSPADNWTPEEKLRREKMYGLIVGVYNEAVSGVEEKRPLTWSGAIGSVPQLIPFTIANKMPVTAVVTGLGMYRNQSALNYYSNLLKEGVSPEDAKSQARMFAVADVGQEYVGLAVFGKMAKTTKIYKKVADKITHSGLVSNVLAKSMTSSTANYMMNVVGGIAEEGFMEPLSGGIAKFAMNPFVENDALKYSGEQFIGDITEMFEAKNLATLSIFSGVMTAGASKSIRDSARFHSNSLATYESLGGSKADYVNAHKLETPEERQKALNDGLIKSWQNDADKAIQRANNANQEAVDRALVASSRQLESFQALQNLGMLPYYEEIQEGKYRVLVDDIYSPEDKRLSAVESAKSNSGVAQSSDSLQFIEMNEQQLNDYVGARITQNHIKAIMQAQSISIGGEITGFMESQGIKLEEISEADTSETLKQLAVNAREAINLLTSTGVSRKEAEKMIDKNLSENLTLGTLENLHEQFQQRTDVETSQDGEFSTNAYVVQQFDKGGSASKILRYVRGQATPVELYEEVMEQSLISYASENGLSFEEVAKQLQEVQRWLNDNEGSGEQFIKLDGSVSRRDALEALSKIGTSNLMAEVVSGTSTLPGWIQSFLRYFSKFIDAFDSIIGVAQDIKKASENNVLSDDIKTLLSVMEKSTGAIHPVNIHSRSEIASKIETGFMKYLSDSFASSKTQEQFGYGVANDPAVVEASLDDINEQIEAEAKEKQEAVQDEIDTFIEDIDNNVSEDEAVVIKATRESEREELDAIVNGTEEPEEVKGVFINGRCFEVTEGVYSGMIEKSKLSLSKDVPQFKEGADNAGVTDALVGKWDATTGEISVLMRKDGSLEVISGRHRFAMCPIDKIKCQVFIESDEYSVDWAKTHDVESNIRDGNASSYAIASYIQAKGMTFGEATERGLTREGVGKKGVQIGLYGTHYVLNALRAKQISDNEAYKASLSFPNNEELQKLVVDSLIEGSTFDGAVISASNKANLEKYVKQNIDNGTIGFDLFGESESDSYYKFAGECASKKIRDINKELKAIEGASKKPEVAKKYNIDIKNPDSLKKAIDSLKLERHKWRNFASYPELLFEINNAWRESKGLEPIKEEELIHIEESNEADESTPDMFADFSLNIGSHAKNWDEYAKQSFVDVADQKSKYRINGNPTIKRIPSFSESRYTSVSLGSVLDYPELYKAYPQLRQMMIKFFREDGSGLGGYYTSHDHYIGVNMGSFMMMNNADREAEVKSVLIHEIQHVIQSYEGFATGASIGSTEEALMYIDQALYQLAQRKDKFALEHRENLNVLRDEVASGVVSPQSVYFRSHGEQESFESQAVAEGREKPIDLNVTVPVVRPVVDMNKISVGSGRFIKMVGKVMAPESDWLQDRYVFDVRVRMKRMIDRMGKYNSFSKEDGLSMIHEASALMNTVVNTLPPKYRFSLEPYNLWLNYFATVFDGANSNNATESLLKALQQIPMEKYWKEVMFGSAMKNFLKYVKNHVDYAEMFEERVAEILATKAELEIDEVEQARKIAEREVADDLFLTDIGVEFLGVYGQAKIEKIVTGMMERAIEKFDFYRKDMIFARLNKALNSVSIQVKNGKAIGNMNAESYKVLENELFPMMNMTKAQYDNAITDYETASKQSFAEAEEDAVVKLDVIDKDGKTHSISTTKQAFTLYGCYSAMNIHHAQACADAVYNFIKSGRQMWDIKKENDKARNQAFAQQLLSVSGNVDPQTKKMLAQIGKKLTAETYVSYMDIFMSSVQYLGSLERIPQLKDFFSMIKNEVSEGIVNMEVSEKERTQFLDKAIQQATGLKTKAERALWVADMKKEVNTNIKMKRQEPDFKERAREQYRERVISLLSKTKQKTHGEVIISLYIEQNMLEVSPDFREQLKNMFVIKDKSSLTEKQRKKLMKHDTVMSKLQFETYGNEYDYIAEHSAKMRDKWLAEHDMSESTDWAITSISPAQASNLILISEQEDYKELMHRKGYTPEVLESLQKIAGKKMMSVAYAMREKLGSRTDIIASISQNKQGSPFVQVDNYWRAVFDVGVKNKEKDITSMNESGYYSSSYKGVMLRVKHNADPDMAIDAFAVFSSAMREQDSYINFFETGDKLRSFLATNQVSDAIEKLTSSDVVTKTRNIANTIDSMGVKLIEGTLSQNKLTNALTSAGAITLLPFRVSTILKNLSTISNSIGCEEITTRQWLRSLGRVMSGTGIISMRDLYQKDVIASRDKSGEALLMKALHLNANQRLNKLETIPAKGFALIDKTDILGNAVSYTVLYDAVYRKMKKENPSLSEEMLHELSLAKVTEEIAVKSQPNNLRQRSLLANMGAFSTITQLFLQGENINTIGNTVKLVRKGNYSKALSLWLANGFIIQLLQAGLDFIMDDEEKRKKRNVSEYILGMILGPLSSVPLIGSAGAWAIGSAYKGALTLSDSVTGYDWAEGVGYRASTSTTIPGVDPIAIGTNAKNLIKKLNDGNATTNDKLIAINNCIRVLFSVGNMAQGNNEKTAVIKGVSGAVTSASNLIDFLLKTYGGVITRE